MKYMKAEIFIYDVRTGYGKHQNGPCPQISNEILQPYVGSRTFLFSSLSLPAFLSLMVKVCVI